MEISYNKNIPLYYQVESFLRSRIESGEISPHTKLPKEKELCKNFRISQGTLRKALEKLENDGLIERKVGRGTFVVPRKTQGVFPIEMRLVGFLEDLILYGKKADVKILSISTVPATEETAKFFGLKEGDKIPQFKRLKMIDGLPIYYVVNLVIPMIGNKITKKDLEHQPPLEIFEKKFERSIEFIEQQIETMKADQEISHQLGLNLFEPILHIHLAVFERNRKPLETVDMYCRGDRYRFIAELKKRKPFRSTLSSGRKRE